MKVSVTTLCMSVVIAFAIGSIVGLWLASAAITNQTCQALGWDTGGVNLAYGYCRQEAESGHALECPYRAALAGTCLPLLETEGEDA